MMPPGEFSNNFFLKTLIDELPCGILILDADRRIRQLNNILEKISGFSHDDAVGKCSGDILNCLNAAEAPGGCGSTIYCEKCIARKAATETLRYNRKFQARGNFDLLINGTPQSVSLYIHAAPFSFEEQRYSIIIIDNISKLEVICNLEQQHFSGKIIGRHKSVQEIYNIIYEVSQVDLPVLIQGESGTGKELIAHAIHEVSSRRHMPFVTLNCAALPHNLLESELFGHEKGSFTGALSAKKGRFELADKGTIFLDEVGELDLAVQAKLLRVLQQGTFERVGGSGTIRTDVRIISATNRKLEEEVEAGRFRLDLYYRLCVVPIHVPSLHDRDDDIPLLADHFLDKAARNFGQARKFLAPASLSLLKAHNWPGNVRELQNVIHFAMMKCKAGTIEPHHLPRYLQPGVNSTGGAGDDTLLRPKTSQHDLAAVKAALAKTAGNKSAAAKVLGISRATLYRFLSIHRPPE